MGRPRAAKQSRDAEPKSAKPEAKAISKADSVRAALADGVDSPGDGVAFIKAKFGIDMPRMQFSAYKAQIRNREKKDSPAEKKPKMTASEDDVIGDIEAVKHLVERLGGDQVRRIIGLFE